MANILFKQLENTKYCEKAPKNPYKWKELKFNEVHYLELKLYL